MTVRMNVNLSTPDRTWEKYGLLEAPMDFNGSESGYKVIAKDDQLISIVRKGYKLLPNEEAVIVADEAAKLAGLVHFDEFEGPWLIKAQDHVILDKNQVHALYVIQRPYEIEGDTMYLGVGVHNSIDGSLGFGCGIFTFRHACENMVWAGMRGYTQSFDQRRTLEYIYGKHTKNLDTVAESLKLRIVKVMDRAYVIVDAYNAMAKRLATDNLISRILGGNLSSKCLPDYIKEDEALADRTEWDIYNDVTELIWHNPDTTMFTKKFYFNALHHAMPLRVAAQ